MEGVALLTADNLTRWQNVWKRTRPNKKTLPLIDGRMRDKAELQISNSAPFFVTGDPNQPAEFGATNLSEDKNRENRQILVFLLFALTCWDNLEETVHRESIC